MKEKNLNKLEFSHPDSNNNNNTAKTFNLAFLSFKQDAKKENIFSELDTIEKYLKTLKEY